MTNSQVNRDIRSNLLNISRLIQEAGDREICRLLNKIIQSPDQIAALHTALGKRLQRQTGKDADTELLKKRQTWFQNFRSSNGEALRIKGADALAKITKDWELCETQTNALLACSTLWASDPRLFWHGGQSHETILRSCYNDLERIREVDPLRRRLLMITLSEQVENFQEKLREGSKAGKGRQKPRRHSKRDRIFLPGALYCVTRHLWPEATPENQEKIRNRINAYSRAGWKWRQLMPVGMLLSFHDSNMKRFERHSWTLVEIQAINSFLKTLPQYRIRSHLENAFNCIASGYSAASISHPGDVPVNSTDLITMDQTPTATTQETQQLESEIASNSNRISNSVHPPECNETTSTTVVSSDRIHNDLTINDTQAAGILSSINGDTRSWPGHQSIPEADQPRDCSSEATEPMRIRIYNRDNSCARTGITPDMVSNVTQTGLQPEEFLVPREQAASCVEGPSFTRMTVQQDDSAFDLAWPLASWEPASYENLLDWGTGLRQDIQDDREGNSLFSPVSNPFLPCDSFNPLISLDWNLLSSANTAGFGEDNTGGDSVSF